MSWICPDEVIKKCPMNHVCRLMTGEGFIGQFLYIYHMPIINRDGNLHSYKVLHDSLLAQEDTVYPWTVIFGFGTDVPHEIFDFVLQGYYTPIFAVCQRKCENSLFSTFSWIFTFFGENSLLEWKFSRAVWKFDFVKMHNFGLGYLSHWYKKRRKWKMQEKIWVFYWQNAVFDI